ncbi:MAG: hypothetical protein P8127_09785 [Acidobacteriota bacterium]
MTTQNNSGSEDAGHRPKFRRRHYLIDRQQQLAATVRVAGLVFILLVVLNIIVGWQAYTATEAVMVANPAMGARMRAMDNRNLAIMAGISLIILAAVVVRSIMYTHRTAGAVYKVSTTLDDVANFDFDTSLRLRSEDSIRGLEEPFNRMVANLRQRAQEDREAMEKLADQIEKNGNPVDAEMLRRIAASSVRPPE